MSPAHKTARDQMLAILEDQPTGSSYDELLRKLALHRMVVRGLAEVESDATISTRELRLRIQAWQS